MIKPPKNLPDSAGVYLFKDKTGQVIYVGKAASLKTRVSSYWRNGDVKAQSQVDEAVAVDFITTPTVIEALILEANLIKKYSPKYNIKGKDNKTFLYVAFPKADFPTPVLIREQDLTASWYPSVFGPFTSASSIRIALTILRGIFPWGCDKLRSKPCFYYQIKRCPGVCAGLADKKKYQKTIKNLIMFFEGKKEKVIKNLEKEMVMLSKQENFEDAAILRDQINALNHIKDVALIREDYPQEKIEQRIEGYDISNISGKMAVGSMVVFTNNEPDKNEYRKFKIKTVSGVNDTAMLAEVLERRFSHPEWKFPNLILIDGGTGQVNSAKKVLKKLNIKIPVAGIAKGPKRKNNILVCSASDRRIFQKNHRLLLRVRDEAHRFAIKYHRSLRKIKK
jgi:excinuclease ABC subunit C